jgi:predicted ATPase
MKKSRTKTSSLYTEPFLCSVSIALDDHVDLTQYPFCLPLIRNTQKIIFPTTVTFLVGENGTGKSTICEAIASHVGFGPEGGSKNINFKTASTQTTAALADYMTLSWSRKPLNGYFLRAESFFNVASYLDDIGVSYTSSYGGKSLHAQSHGESFFALFSNRLGDGGFFILDEPEAALSPQRQLCLLKIIHDLSKNYAAQFIIATHSPILLAYPNATIYSCDGDTIQPIEYADTAHYQITKNFLNNPELYLKNLFRDE